MPPNFLFPSFKSHALGVRTVYKFAEFKNFASNPLAKIILISTQATGRENLELAARRVRKSGRQADSGRENPTSNSENLPYFTPAWQG